MKKKYMADRRKIALIFLHWKTLKNLRMKFDLNVEVYSGMNTLAFVVYSIPSKIHMQRRDVPLAKNKEII